MSSTASYGIVNDIACQGFMMACRLHVLRERWHLGQPLSRVVFKTIFTWMLVSLVLIKMIYSPAFSSLQSFTGAFESEVDTSLELDWKE
jgi:hypothetical protein